MKKPLKKAEGDSVDPIEAAQEVIREETHATVPRKIIESAIAAYEAARRRLPETRCGHCGNGIDVIWNHCPWCGNEADWQALRPGPHHQPKHK